MAEVKWIKIVTDIFDDEKILMIESMPDADSIIVIWFKLLTLSGKINNGGVLMFNDKLPYTDEMLATIFRRPINTIRLALNTFEKFGMVEIINNAITIPNWGKHQSLDQLEERKDYMKNYMREYRAKQKELAEGKVNSKVNSKANVNSLEEEGDIDKEEDIDIDKDTTSTAFDEFWKVYPKKVGKEAARKAFKKVPKKSIPLLRPAVEQQKQSAQWNKDGGQFIPSPSRWLNEGRWEDELPKPTTSAPTVQEGAAPGKSSNDIRKLMDML